MPLPLALALALTLAFKNFRLFSATFQPFSAVVHLSSQNFSNPSLSAIIAITILIFVVVLVVVVVRSYRCCCCCSIVDGFLLIVVLAMCFSSSFFELLNVDVIFEASFFSPSPSPPFCVVNKNKFWLLFVSSSIVVNYKVQCFWKKRNEIKEDITFSPCHIFMLFYFLFVVFIVGVIVGGKKELVL